MIEIIGLDDVLKTTNSKAYIQALNRTINDLGTKSKNEMVRNVRSQYNIKAADLKKFMKERKSKYNSLEFVLDVRSKPFNAMRFNPRKLKKRGKVSILISKGQGRKVFKNPTFFAKNGAVLQRKGNEIKGVYTLSIPQMFKDKNVKTGLDLVKNEFEDRFQNNLNFYTKKA